MSSEMRELIEDWRSGRLSGYVGLTKTERAVLRVCASELELRLARTEAGADRPVGEIGELNGRVIVLYHQDEIGHLPKGTKLYTHPQDASGDAEKDAEIARLNAIINSPQSDDFLRAVSTEAEHQRQRWGSDHDAGKAPADWFWLVGYLGGKALHSHAAGDTTKAEHHIITTAAACANWHRAMFGRTDMRPGIDGQAAMQAKEAK